MPGSRRGSRIGDAEAPPNRRSSVLVDEEHARKLISDVSNEEAEGMLTQVQTVSTAFRGFSGDQLAVLSEALSVMRFEEGQVLVEQGAVGTVRRRRLSPRNPPPVPEPTPTPPLTSPRP